MDSVKIAACETFAFLAMSCINSGSYFLLSLLGKPDGTFVMTEFTLVIAVFFGFSSHSSTNYLTALRLLCFSGEPHGSSSRPMPFIIQGKKL